MIEINKIYFEDCLEGMNKIEDKSIDMILCDLPYGKTSCKWDVRIPFDLLWKQYKRIIKQKSVILLFGVEPFSSIQRMSNLEWYKYDWYWDKAKPNGWQNSKNKPMEKIETISVFSPNVMGHISLLKEKRMKYFPQNIVPSGKKIVKSYWHNSEAIGSRDNQTGRQYESFTNFPNNLLSYSNVKGKKIHPTQKPVDLLEYLIKTYSSENELILDNCMGSGSTAIACINTNRNYIGFENDSKYFAIAEERIKNNL